MAAFSSLIISCEHASASVPPAYAEILNDAAELLATHRASDLGAFTLARALAASLKAPLLAGAATRLLVDLNRSASNPRVFSRFSRRLGAEGRAELLRRWHTPHRTAVLAALQAAPKPVAHLAVHSFTPILKGRERRADLGLLYDPRRAPEKALALELRASLQTLAPDLRLRRNYPYRGTSDGLPTWLRRQFKAEDYAGLELELNQADWNPASQAWQSLDRLLTQALETVFAELIHN